MLFGFLNKKPKTQKESSVDTFQKILSLKVPSEAIPYVVSLWQKHPFSFVVSRPRKSVLGNYTYKAQRHIISVNGNSNPYSFLVTLVHEIAHQHIQIQYARRKVLPHGLEWKRCFSELMQPLLTEQVFPENILSVLKVHMQNPAASSTKDPALMHALGIDSSAEFEENGEVLEQIPEGSVFIFNQKKYKKIADRRTRTLVQLDKTNKRFTILSHAKVKLVD